VLAHCRLGYMGIDRLLSVLKAGKTRGLGKLEMSVSDIATARERVLQCTACKEGKGTQQSYSHRGPLNHGSSPGEVLHMDTFEVRTEKGHPAQYGVIIVDPFSGGLFCPIVSSKDKIANAVIEVMKKVKASTGKVVKVLHSDGGTEFINSTLKSYCAGEGTTMTRSPPKVPQLNGIAERFVRVVKDGARTMLRACGLADVWWHRAVTHFVYMWNRVYVSSRTNMTPFESFYGIEPSVSSTNVFGCDVYVWLHKDRRQAGTFAPRGEPGIYLGHDPDANCAIVWLIKSNKEIRERSIDYRNTQFSYARAYTSGLAAINKAVSDSDVGGELAWCDASEVDTESKLQQLSDSLESPSKSTPDLCESEEEKDEKDEVLPEDV
jgi:transposase InsO family protein